MKLLILLSAILLLESLNAQKNYEITNLKAVNTEKNEKAPAFYDQEGRAYLIFASNQKRNIEDIYISKLTVKNKALNQYLYSIPESYDNGLKNHLGNKQFFISKESDMAIAARPSKNGGSIILRAKRGEKGWEEMTRLPWVIMYDKNAPKKDYYNVAYPNLTSDGSMMFFASDMPGGFGGWDLYVSFFEKGRWSPPVNLGPDVNSEENEISPFIADDNMLYFSSDRKTGKGGYDIYFSKEKNGKWENVMALDGLNTEANEEGFIIRGKYGYLASDRKEGKGGYDIYAWHLK